MSKKPIIVCIGNSIVNGFPHRRSQCFVSGLRDSLPEYDVVNKGENGDTAAGVLMRFQKDVLDKHPYAVMLLTGSNDFILGSESVESCMDKVREITEVSLKNGIRVIHLTPIICDAEKAERMWMPADYIDANRKLCEFSERLKEYSLETDHKAKEIFSKKKNMHQDEYIMHDAYCIAIDLQKEYLKYNDFVDGIHPTVKGHDIISDLILRTLNSL